MARRTKQPTLKPRLAAEALREDPVLGPWVRVVGGLRIPRSTEAPFGYLARAIVYQQLAGRAAATIHGRVIAAVGGSVTPTALARVSDQVLRGAGLSANKLAAVRDLQTKARVLELDALEWLPDDEVVERLVSVRGIGPWTAHMFLMFHLRRPDVWPVGDLGVRAGYARARGWTEPPTEKELLPLGETFRPWRSAAAWYCWRIVETELPA